MPSAMQETDEVYMQRACEHRLDALIVMKSSLLDRLALLNDLSTYVDEDENNTKIAMTLSNLHIARQAITRELINLRAS